MTKSIGVKHTTIEVWTSDYINFPEHRDLPDQNAVILQVEPGCGDNAYMVEVFRPNNGEKHAKE